jgi:hypothetical protein
VTTKVSNQADSNSAGTQPLNPVARRRLAALFAQIETASDEREMVERERRRRPAGSAFDDLNRRRATADASHDEAIFALGLGLGQTPDEAADSTIQAIHERAWAEERADREASRPSTSDEAEGGGIVLPFRQTGRREVPVEREAAVRWMTSRESAEYARKVSASGQISGGWRETLRRLETQGLAERMGKHPNSELRVLKCTVDAVIRGQIDLEGGENR